MPLHLIDIVRYEGGTAGHPRLEASEHFSETRY